MSAFPRSLTLVALLLAAALAYAAAGPAPDRDAGDAVVAPATVTSTSLTLDVVAIACPPAYHNGRSDNVCLAYDGTVPGPTLVFREGDVVSLTLRNRVAETIADLDAPASVKSRLAAAPLSLHRHGVVTAAAHDGMGPHAGTQFADARAPPGGSFTYAFTAPFPGSWHYHDHALTASDFGAEGGERGLFGAMLVLPASEPVGAVFDLHLLDAGPNGGLGLDGDVAAGQPFRFALAGLGDQWWSVTVTAPDGATLASVDVAPGVSHGVFVPSAQPGSYRWTATSPFHPAPFQGEVRVP